MVGSDGCGLLSRQRVGEFEHMAAERDLAELVQFRRCALRAFGPRDENELTVGPPPEIESYLSERFELTLEAAARRLGAFGYTAQLAEVARQQSDDPIGLGVIACAQHDGSSGFFRRQGDTAHRRGAKRKESEV